MPGCVAPDDAREVGHERASLAAADADDGGGPLADVAFPPPHSATSESTIRVRGTARANADIVSIEANGVAAQTSDGFATWWAEVPLELGANDIEVVATTQKHEKTKTKPVARLSVGRELELPSPRSLAMDAEGNRVLVLDGWLAGLFSIDLDTGAAREISSAKRGAGPSLQVPLGGVSLDATGNRALVTDRSRRAVLAVDLATGDRAILSGATTGTGPAFLVPNRISVDAEANRAFVTDTALRAVLAVDLATGARTVISGPTVGAGPAFGEPTGVVLDAPAHRLLVTDPARDGVLSVDLATGNRALFSNSSFCPRCVDFLTDIELDRAHNRAVILNAQFSYIILAMDLDSGALSLVAGANSGRGPFYASVPALALDPAHDRILLAAPELRAVVGLQPGPSEGPDRGWSITTHLTRLAVGAGPRPVLATHGLSINPRASLTFESGQHALLRVDAVTGDRRVAAELSPRILYAAGLTHEGDDRVIIGDRGGDCGVIYSFELSSGLGTPIGGLDSPGPCLESIEDLVYDEARRRLLAITEEQGVFAIDRDTGERTQISGEDVGSGPEFLESIMLALDPARDRVLVTDEDHEGLL
ncbi:MAG TPA: hypothetical protein VNM90_15130, partial [Haliangium sp.]|nr:hypothetical protein [Haliangium sp.]